jgi:N-dimethylarginine dimethylaminohydrolase
LTEGEKQISVKDGYANFFVRDPFFTIGNCVIEGSLRFEHRRNEILPVRDLFSQEVYPESCVYIAAPRPAVGVNGDLGTGPFIEGGDILILGKHILVGTSGLASNSLGITWLAKFLRPYGYTVELVRLHPDILHLDCALSLVCNGFMVICKKAFLDNVPHILHTWKAIEVNLQEASALATNGLSISESVYITDPEFERIGLQIESEGLQVEYIDFSISRSFGGSFRCSTQPLWRED